MPIYCKNCRIESPEPRVTITREGEEYGVCPQCGATEWIQLNTCHVCKKPKRHSKLHFYRIPDEDTNQMKEIAICDTCRTVIHSDHEWHHRFLARAYNITSEVLEEITHEQSTQEDI